MKGEESFMSPYDETYQFGRICQPTGKYKNEEITSVRTFMKPNHLGHWNLYNMWFYLKNGYILKFFDTEGEDSSNNLMLVCDKEDR